MALPDIRSVDDYRPQVATLILDRTNRPIDAIAKEFRVVIPYAELARPPAQGLCRRRRQPVLGT